MQTEAKPSRPCSSTSSRASTAVSLADHVDDVDAWLRSFTDDERRRPAIQIEIARRLAVAGRAGDARTALDAAREIHASTPKRAATVLTPPDDAWHAAEIAVLDAEERREEAMEARWIRFEQSLSPDVLRELVSRLPDFEDVEATDRAIAFAASYFDLMKALGLLVELGETREAARLIVERQDELNGRLDAVPLWASRLAGRHDLAALLLLRARIRALHDLGGEDPDKDHLLAEAEDLASRVDDIESHSAFLGSLAKPEPAKRRGWLR